MTGLQFLNTIPLVVVQKVEQENRLHLGKILSAIVCTRKYLFSKVVLNPEPIFMIFKGRCSFIRLYCFTKYYH